MVNMGDQVSVCDSVTYKIGQKYQTQVKNLTWRVTYRSNVTLLKGGMTWYKYIDTGHCSTDIGMH